MKLCKRCVLPDTKPDLVFGDDGVCAACHAFQNRSEIDWVSREEEFHSAIQPYIKKGNWDCIIPVSGGKDSTYQLLKILDLGLRPLAVTSSTCSLSEIGRSNLHNIGLLGVDHIEVTPDRVTRSKMNLLGLELVGDISWPEHVGIFTIPVIMAVQLGIQLIIWGENSQNEYGGPATAVGNKVLNRRWLEEFGGLLGLRVSDLPSMLGVSERDLAFYRYPSDEDLERVGVTGLFLGHFFPWDGLSNAITAQAFGLRTFGTSIEGSIVDYENLDNYQTGIHDYFKYLKFGFGRVSDLASVHIRRGRMSREQALKLVLDRDGTYPTTYLGKSIDDTLQEIGLTRSKFDQICDRFTSRALFQQGRDGALLRRQDGSPARIDPQV